MNVYLVERTDTVDYDEWDSVVVVAATEEEALDTAPAFVNNSAHPTHWVSDWTQKPRKATLVATGAEGPRRTVLSSFNAG